MKWKKVAGLSLWFVDWPLKITAHNAIVKAEVESGDVAWICSVHF